MKLWGGKSGELALGQEFALAHAGTTGIVGTEIGSGGQGIVYHCDVGGRQLVLKWYRPGAANQAQRERIDRLIAEGAPDKRFIFPVDLATVRGREGFGYVMAAISPDRKQFDKVIFDPGFALEKRATACYEIADCFQQLHAAGLSYQDLNFGGFFVDPIRGGVLICDADNITADGRRGGVYGAPGFQAPEIVTAGLDALPSTQTDLHSMAVVFFAALLNCHPLEGGAFFGADRLDAAGRLKVYGREARFIFDPAGGAGCAALEGGAWIAARWKAMPTFLRDLFTRAFTTGLRDPGARVVEAEWRAAMARLRDAVTRCPACGFEVPLEPAGAEAAPDCPACGTHIPRPLRMTLGRYLVSMLPTRELYAHHVDAAAGITLRDTVASVDAHPADATIVGLRNLTPTPWHGRTQEGGAVTVVPGRTVRILDGLGIDFGRREGMVAGADRPGRAGA